jgi:prepilin-type N-terminal cleavage/methylation domain-containing protein
MSPGLKRCGGYSLIEILVVLSIVGTLALVAVFYRLDRYGPAVKGVLQDVQTAVLEARSMARQSGRSVTLTITGTGTNAGFTYAVTGGPSGSYSLNADPSASHRCLIDSVGSGNPTAAALTNLQDHLEGVTFGSATDPSGVWTTNLFSASTPMTFNPMGIPNAEMYIAVVSQTNGVVIADGPVGIILINSFGNMYRYYRSNNTSSWMRL